MWTTKAVTEWGSVAAVAKAAAVWRSLPMLCLGSPPSAGAVDELEAWPGADETSTGVGRDVGRYRFIKQSSGTAHNVAKLQVELERQNGCGD